MSILPPPQKDGEIKFWLAKTLPYRARMTLVGLLLTLGLGLQVTIGFLPGLWALVAAMLIGINSGYQAVPKITGEETWEKVTPDEYAKVRLRADQLKKWDEDFFDGSSISGLAGFFTAAVLCLIAYFAATSRWNFPDGSWLYFGLDAAVLIFPMWFIGTREYLRKDRLIIKINLLEKVIEALKDPSDVQVQPMLALDTTDKGSKVPEDARLMVKLVGAPKDFYGLQVQLSVNSVQGKDYPYLYCVLITKAGSGLLAKYEDFTERPESSGVSDFVKSLFGMDRTDILYESSRSGEVDIIVVRQLTTRTSGYYTSPGAALGVVDAALKLARALMAANAQPAVEKKGGI